MEPEVITALVTGIASLLVAAPTAFFTWRTKKTEAEKKEDSDLRDQLQALWTSAEEYRRKAEQQYMDAQRRELECQKSNIQTLTDLITVKAELQIVKGHNQECNRSVALLTERISKLEKPASIPPPSDAA